jgi:MFS-type transporter involved in bile tolerance (Atg22 family)
MFFVHLVAGIQYWMTLYMIDGLKVDQYTVSVAYSIISITAPILGVIFGGFLAERLGGYHKPRVRKVLPLLSSIVFYSLVFHRQCYYSLYKKFLLFLYTLVGGSLLWRFTYAQPLRNHHQSSPQDRKIGKEGI